MTPSDKLRVIGVNVLVTFALLGFLLLLIPAVFSVRLFFRSTTNDQGQVKASLPNMAQYPWARDHFNEFPTSKVQYKDFEIWRREPIALTTINVDAQGFRYTKRQVEQGQESVAFFGGSTMWGYGVNDANTIPSHFADLSQRPSFNYGEVGFVARQSLNRLLNLYARNSNPRIVVFYDGVNEPAHKCRVDQDYASGAQEIVIKDRLQSNGFLFSEDSTKRLASFRYLFEPTISALSKMKSRLATAMGRKEPPQDYNCDTDAAKVQAIARSWFQDWSSAKELVEGHGGMFLGVLQPTSHLSSPYRRHLVESGLVSEAHHKMMSAQYQPVYRAFKELLAERQFDYLDLEDSLDSDVPYYIDFCHLTPDGNRLIATRMWKRLQAVHIQ
jgi:hypothetical protein